MNYKALLICSLLVVSLTMSSAAYNETLAVELSILAGAAYCPSIDLLAGTCGIQCDYLKAEDIIPYFSAELPTEKSSVALSLFAKNSTKEFIVSFRGTFGSSQLFEQILGLSNVNFDLIFTENITQVNSFIFRNYKDIMRAQLVGQIQAAKQIFPDFTFIFTGHSLGGAFATLAATDAVVNNLVEGASTKVYSFGSPRVGDCNFSRLHSQMISQSYRVVHQRDYIPHVPPCVRGASSGTCVQYDRSMKVWFPYHSGTEIFYDNDDMTLGSQVVCKEAEDSTCSNKYTMPLINDHHYYFGSPISCNGTSSTIWKVGSTIDSFTKFLRGSTR